MSILNKKIKIRGGRVGTGFTFIDSPSTKFDEHGVNTLSFFIGGDSGKKVLANLEALKAGMVVDGGAFEHSPFTSLNYDDNPKEPGVMLTLKHKVWHAALKKIVPLVIKSNGKILPMDDAGALLTGLEPGEGSECDIIFSLYKWKHGASVGFSLELHEVDFGIIFKRVMKDSRDGAVSHQDDGSFDDWS